MFRNSIVIIHYPSLNICRQINCHQLLTKQLDINLITVFRAKTRRDVLTLKLFSLNCHQSLTDYGVTLVI